MEKIIKIDKENVMRPLMLLLRDSLYNTDSKVVRAKHTKESATVVYVNIEHLEAAGVLNSYEIGLSVEDVFKGDSSPYYPFVPISDAFNFDNNRNALYILDKECEERRFKIPDDIKTGVDYVEFMYLDGNNEDEDMLLELIKEV